MVSDRPALDLLTPDEVISLLLDAEARVVPSVRRASRQLVAAAELLAAAIREHRMVIFAGAGTSGRVAAAEAAELPGTFGIPVRRCRVLLAGAGVNPTDPLTDDSAEDDEDAARLGVQGLRPVPGDVLVAVAASGRTPFTLAAAAQARSAGASVIAVVNAVGTPLAASADVAIELVVGDEVLRGSTRLTAGTAQKVALNTLTTAAMAQAGRVHGDLMIDVVPANAKLEQRQSDIVAQIALCSPAEAAVALRACGGDARAAVVHLVRGAHPADAVEVAGRHASLRSVLSAD